MEDNWWEVEDMSMDNPFMISSPPPKCPSHPPPPPIPLYQPQPLPYPQNMRRGFNPTAQPIMTNQGYTNPNFINTTNMNKTNVPNTANNKLLTIEEDNQQSNNAPINNPPGSQGANTVRRPGRPLGSPNKIKPLTLIKKDNYAMQSAILDITHDSDVMDCLKTYATIYQSGLTVMSGTGYVKDVTLHQLGSTAKEVIIKLTGKHEILAITGGFFPEPSPQTESGLKVYISDGNGLVIGGVVVGQLVAYGLVRIVAAYFTSTTSESLPLSFLVSHQNIPQFAPHMQIENVGTTSAAAPAPAPPQPREGFAGKQAMAETSSVPPLNQGYRGVAPPYPPSYF